MHVPLPPSSSIDPASAMDAGHGLGAAFAEGLSGGWTGGLPLGVIMILLVGVAAWLAGGRLLRVVLAGTGALFIGSLGWTVAGEAGLPGPPIAWAALAGGGGALIGLAATRLAVAGLAAIMLGALLPVVAHHQWSRQDPATVSVAAADARTTPPPAMRVAPGPLDWDGTVAESPTIATEDGGDAAAPVATPATRGRSGEIIDSVSDWLTRQGEATRERERAGEGDRASRPAAPPAEGRIIATGPASGDAGPAPDAVGDGDDETEPPTGLALPAVAGPMATATPALAAEAGGAAAEGLGFDRETGAAIARRSLDAARAGLDHPAATEARSVAARWWLGVDPARRPTLVGLALAGALVGAAGGLVFAGAASRVVTAATGSLLVLTAGMALFGDAIVPALAGAGLLPDEAIAAGPETVSEAAAPPVAITTTDSTNAPTTGLSDVAIAAPAATAGTWFAMTLLGAVVQWRYRPRVSDIER